MATKSDDDEESMKLSNSGSDDKKKEKKVESIDTTQKTKPNCFVHLLTVVFGCAPLLGISATLLQLPVLVQTTPEGWKLPAYVGIILLFAALGPILYPVYQKFAKYKINEKYAIYAVFTISLLACVVAMSSVRKTVWIFGAERSLPFFIVTFLVGTAAYTSAVVCLPYMGRFLVSYMYTFMIGEALSGFFPSILGLIQGAGGEFKCIESNKSIAANGLKLMVPVLTSPRFSSEYFYIPIFFAILGSLVCFALLDNLDICKKQYAPIEEFDEEDDYHYNNVKSEENQDDVSVNKEETDPDKLFPGLMALSFTMAFIFLGFVPCVQAYATLPYGMDTLHLSAVISLVLGPVCPFISLFLKNRSLLVIGATTLGWMACCMYVIVAAFMSPTPPLVGTLLGKVLMIFTFVGGALLAGYAKICITTLLRERGGRSLMYNGGLFQAGRSVGTIVGFCLVKYTDLFVRTNIHRC